MGSGNSRSLTIDREDYSERIPRYSKKQTRKSDDMNGSADSGFDESFEPAKTDFVKNLSYSASTPGELITESELKELKHIYDQKISRIHDETAERHGVTVDHMAKTVERLEKKFLKASSKTICGDMQADLVECLKKNRGESLNCISSIDRFSSCMQQYRAKEGMNIIHHQIGACNTNNTNNVH